MAEFNVSFLKLSERINNTEYRSVDDVSMILRGLRGRIWLRDNVNSHLSKKPYLRKE